MYTLQIFRFEQRTNAALLCTLEFPIFAILSTHPLGCPLFFVQLAWTPQTPTQHVVAADCDSQTHRLSWCLHTFCSRFDTFVVYCQLASFELPRSLLNFWNNCITYSPGSYDNFMLICILKKTLDEIDIIDIYYQQLLHIFKY